MEGSSQSKKINQTTTLTHLMQVLVTGQQQRRHRIRASSIRAEGILVAATNGSVSVLAKHSDEELFDAECTSGCSALHWAAGANQVEIIHYLLRDRRKKKSEQARQESAKESWFHANMQVTAGKKARGRAPLHYACRNGCYDAAVVLIASYGASADITAKGGITPFQLAIWRNQRRIAQWLVEDCGVNPAQLNDFECGAAHWLSMAPVQCADDGRYKEEDEEELESDHAPIIAAAPNESGSALVPTAVWLSQQVGIDFTATQKQGHAPLHKAAWMGHLAMCRYLHENHDVWDDRPDQAGNYAVDLCRMAPQVTILQRERYQRTINYLREHCSRDRSRSCAVLDIPLTADDTTIRRAYLQKVRLLHPDNADAQKFQVQTHNAAAANARRDEFDAVQRAYQHLTEEQGRGRQSNPTHSLKLMLTQLHINNNNNNNNVTNNSKSPGEAQKMDEGNHEEPSQLSLEDPTTTTTNDNNCFKARLIAVLLEYGDKGLDLSNLKKKWTQVWPDEPFPNYQRQQQQQQQEQECHAVGKKKQTRRLSLSDWIRQTAMDVVDVIPDDKGCLRLYAKHCSQASVKALQG